MKVKYVNDKWDIQSWTAKGDLGFELDGLNLDNKASASIEYSKTGEQETYRLGGNLAVASGGLFTSDIDAKNVILEKNKISGCN